MGEIAPGSGELALVAPIQGGQMLARRSGQAVLIHGGIPGETIRHGDLAAKRGYLEGDAEAVVSPAPARRAPPCPYFGENGRRRGSVQNDSIAPGPICGGCQYQHISYDSQLVLKAQIVREQLRRVGKILNAPVHAVWPSPAPTCYRNKAAWIVGPAGELAYHEARSHRLVPVDQCLLLTPALQGIFNSLRTASSALGLSGRVHSIEARSLPDGSGEELGTAALTFDVRLSPSDRSDVARALLEACPRIASVSGISLDRPADCEHLAGIPRLRIAFLDFSLSLSPSTFFQVNLPVAEQMARHVLEQMAPLQKRVVLDAYSGAGAFTVPAASSAKAVVALEIDALAVSDLRESLVRLGIDNVTVLQGDAGFSLRSLLPGSVDCAVLDPPRSGCSKQVLRHVARIRVPRLIYVSCDPSTLARDLRYLLDQGFVLDSVQPFDLFPQTAHIECVASLKLLKKYRDR